MSDRIQHGPKSRDCGRPELDLPLVEEMGFSQREQVMLNAIRHLCCGITGVVDNASCLAWDCLNQAWQDDESVEMLGAITELLRVLGDTRRAPFDFVDPRCVSCSQHIGQTEVQLILFLRAAQSFDTRRMEDYAQLLVVSGKPLALLSSALSFARVAERCSNAAYSGTSGKQHLVH